ncbi:MAG: ShlB/FhaC/HecB family hemolysin secretion/activation protein [Betaproteobacteria bacterium]|nr:ShlB/FhaC/HecB family hemolysin secretion/activation protein [Betaproteobacteria bacterium]
MAAAMLLFTSMALPLRPFAQDGTASPPAQSAQADPGFDIDEYRVRGNTVLKTRDIERVLIGRLGAGKTAADVEEARAALEKAFHDQGYLTVFVDVPPQRVTHGIVVLKVTEGTVRRNRVTGSRYFSLERTREGIPSLAEGSVPDFDDVQRELNVLNSSRDRRVTPILKPAPERGRVDVELAVQDQFPLHGSVEVSNRQSLYTTSSRLSAQVRYDNLWQRGHSLSFLYEVAPERRSDASVQSLAYSVPAAGGARYTAYAVHSSSSVAAVGTLNVIGQGEIVGVRANYSLPSNEQLRRSFTVGVDYKHFNRDISLPGAPPLRTPLAYAPVSLDYNATAAGERGTTTVDAGLSFLLRGLANTSDEFTGARSQADTAFVILKGGVQRNHGLPGQWSVQVRLDGQLASGPLVSNEQFAAGGSTSVRGYKEFEVFGDAGLRASIEVRSAPIAGSPASRRQAYVLGFVDGATLAVMDPLPSQQARFRIASAGIGLRWQRDDLYFDIDGALALLDAARVPVAGNTMAGDNRMHARLSYVF